MALEDDIRVMAQAPLLAEVPRDGLRLLAFSAESRILHAGDVLFREGQPADSGFVVISGALALGRGELEAPAARIVRQGCLVGELALLCETVRPVTAIAREPSQVLRIPRLLFLRVLEEFPGVAARLHAALAERVLAETADLAVIGEQLHRPLPPRKPR